MSSSWSTCSSISSSSRSSPDLSTNYRTTIDGQITAFKMWGVDNRVEMEQRFPEQMKRPGGMQAKVKSYWRYHVSQEEKDYYYEMEAEIKAGGGVVQKPYPKMEPILETYEAPPVLEAEEPVQEFNPQGHIKRPLNAFILWGQVERKRIQERSPKMMAPEIARKLGEDWKRLSDGEKKPFFEQAEKLKKQHQKMYPGYKFQPKKLMTHLESMNRRRQGRKFNPIYTPPPSAVATSSEAVNTSEPPSSMTPILDALLAQPLTMVQELNPPLIQIQIQNPNPEPEPEYEYQNQKENWDPSIIEYEPTGLATMEQRCDLHLLPSRYLCPESDEQHFSIYDNIPMALGYADLPVFY